MKKNPEIILLLLIFVFYCCHPKGNNKLSENKLIKLNKGDTLKASVMKIENNKAVLVINLNGGSYPEFYLKDLPVNPLNWRSTDPDSPDFMGHFLCFDRWGPPSAGEKENGFKHHGEVNTVKWTIINNPAKINHLITCSMMCILPMGKLQLTRKIEMPENEPIFSVTEEIQNLNKYGRMFNIVQHVTLGPPFLDTTTLFDNNTEKGFEDKEDGSLNQEEPVIKWPEVNHKGEKISLRQFKDEWPRVCSFVFNQDEKYGWTTACNPSKNLMIGYLWKTEDYPWINFWRSMENKTPKAFGMEFGTTGLHEPFPIIAKKGKIFNRNLYDFIDAGEIIKKSYTAFLGKIPEDFKGVEKIEVQDSLIIVTEKGDTPRKITYHSK